VADSKLTTGTKVQVHTRFNDSWISGFEVAEVLINGYRVRRTSDGSVLPGYTSTEDLRLVP
jgi:hypothetical protein